MTISSAPGGMRAAKLSLAVLAALMLCIVGSPAARAQSTGNIDLKSVEPKDIKDLIAQNKGKVVVLNFFATWCVPCHKEFPDIVKLQAKYKAQGLQVIEVSMNDVTEKDDMQKFLNETKPPFAVYIAANTEDQFYKDVDARWDTALPMTMIYDRDGKNIYFYKEARSYDQFDKDITPLLAASAK
jgi:thiol-disulfide isomerase/thioredoxin